MAALPPHGTDQVEASPFTTGAIVKSIFEKSMFEKSRFRYSRNRDARFEVPSKELIKEGQRKDGWVQGWLVSAPPPPFSGLTCGARGELPTQNWFPRKPTMEGTTSSSQLHTLPSTDGMASNDAFRSVYPLVAHALKLHSEASTSSAGG